MKNLETLLLLAVGFASPALAASEEWEEPRFQVVATGGAADFRGGQPASSALFLAVGVPFQPDATSPSVGGAVLVRVVRHLAFEAEVAYAPGRTTDGRDNPDNTFFTGGLQLAWPLWRGKLVPYVSAGGGAVTRKPQDPLQKTIEHAFAVRSTDPVAYAGAGVGWRLSRLLGLRGEYRFTRVFPERADAINADRDAYNAHRFGGGVTFSFR